MTTYKIISKDGVKYFNELISILEEEGDEADLFLNNKKLIRECFEQNNAIIALECKKIVGYIIWEDNGEKVYIPHLYVAKINRKHGIGTKLINTLSNLLASRRHMLYLEAELNSEEFYRKKGWESEYNAHNKKIFYKVIVQHLKTNKELSNGNVLVTCSANFYDVKSQPDKYKEFMKYFCFDSVFNKSQLPIIIYGTRKSYFAIYRDKMLLEENEIRYLKDANANLGIITIDTKKLLQNKNIPNSKSSLFEPSSAKTARKRKHKENQENLPNKKRKIEGHSFVKK